MTDDVREHGFDRHFLPGGEAKGAFLPAEIAGRACPAAATPALRPNEIRQAGWGEFHFEAGVWTLPGAKMKGDRAQARAAHRVPITQHGFGRNFRTWVDDERPEDAAAAEAQLAHDEPHKGAAAHCRPTCSRGVSSSCGLGMLGGEHGGAELSVVLIGVDAGATTAGDFLF